VFVRCLYNMSRFVCRSHVAILSNLIISRVQPTSYHSLVPWTQSRFSPESPTMSSSGSLLLDEQTLGRLQFFSESATPPRVPRSMASINLALTNWCVLVLSGTFDLIFYLGSTRPFDGGLADYALFMMADREDPSCAAWRA
jgi:hypothetical protein